MNVRTGYADPDHRAETHEKREFKRGSLKNLRLEVQEGYMATSLAYYCTTRYRRWFCKPLTAANNRV